MYPNQQPPNNNQADGTPPPAPPQNGGYGPQPQPTYAVDYLDQIAPPPAKAKFLSGSFGKIVIALGVIFIFAVGIIVALGNQKGTLAIEQMATKLEHIEELSNDIQKDVKDGNLKATNSNFNIWLKNTDRDAYSLLGQAGVKRNDIDKKVITDSKAAKAKLTTKFEDARLNAELDRVYAREMAYQGERIKADLDKIAKTGTAKAFREWAKSASTNLEPIIKSFDGFNDSGN